MTRYAGFGGPTAPHDTQTDAVVAPKSCPACGGRELKTTSKAADRSSYWRCLGCGEIWNLNRRETSSRYGYR